MSGSHSNPIGPRQSPVRLPVVAMADLQNGWWPGVPTRCQYPLCGGLMAYTPPDRFNGRVACVSCSRETYEVVDRIYTVPAFPQVRRGRPKKDRPLTRPLCRVCATRQARHASQHCRRCAPKRGHYEVYKRHTPAVLELLQRSDRPLKSHEIAAVIGAAPHTIRHLIRLAQKNGAQIETVGHGYEIRGAA